MKRNFLLIIGLFIFLCSGSFFNVTLVSAQDTVDRREKHGEIRDETQARREDRREKRGEIRDETQARREDRREDAERFVMRRRRGERIDVRNMERFVMRSGLGERNGGEIEQLLYVSFVIHDAKVSKGFRKLDTV